MHWYLKVLKQYVDFDGRARRKEFWMFQLFNTIFLLLAIFLDRHFGWKIIGLEYGPITLVYILAVLLPSLAVHIRRLHDIGKSGYWLFISLVPFIGNIWSFILLCMDSEGENEWGDSPKYDY